MPTYIYRARDKYGELLTADIEVDNEMDAAASLRSMGYSVISIELKKQFFPKFSQILQSFRRSNQHELVLFSRQMSTLLKSGVPLTNAISSIKEQIRSRPFKEALGIILKDIEAGVPFSQGLSKYPQFFSDVFVNMIKAAETAGIIDDVLDRIAKLSSRELEIKNRIKSAMIYPVILVIVAFIVINFFLVSIVPKFVVIFKSYRVNLPLPTQILLAVSFFLKQAWLVISGGVFIAVFVLRSYLKTDKGRYKLGFFLLRLPVFGELYLNVIVSRMCRTLGAMVKSGVPILAALYVTSKTINNLVVRRVIENVRLSISEGQPLSEPFRASGVFPTTVIQMISVGEKSGNLDQMLLEVASFYEEEVDYAIKNITTALEPMLLIAMGGAVAFIALSVLLPIFNLVKVFKH